MEVEPESIPEPKKTRDFSSEVAELMPRATEMARSGRLTEAIETVLALEKQCRQAGDAISNAQLLCTVVQMCFDANDWQKLNEYIVILSKKRGQLKRAIVDMVQRCMTFLDRMPSKDLKVELITTLRNVTAGKIFVEVERARLTRIFAHMKEQEGNVPEAAETLQEVQVETYGAMEKREKAEFILDQMRLVLLKGDFIRLHIISKKINKRILDELEFQDIKVQFYQFMIKYYHSEGKYLDVCKCWQAIYDTPRVKEDPAQWQPALANMVLYCILAPYDNEQSDLLHRIQQTESKRLQQLPAIAALLKQFLTLELIAWPLPGEAALQAMEPFAAAEGAARWRDFRKRAVQHNIRVIGKYYSRIAMPRLAQLLGLDVRAAELELSEMVSGKFLHAKIDRPDGVVSFARRKEANELLNDWAGDIGNLLELVEKTCHLIHKETMVHKVEAAAATAAQ